MRGRWVAVTALMWGTAGLAQAGRGVERLVLTLQSAVPCQVPALGVGDGVRAHLWVAGLFALQAGAFLAVRQSLAWHSPPPSPPSGPSGPWATPAPFGPRAWALLWALGSVGLSWGVGEGYPQVWPLLDPMGPDAARGLTGPQGEGQEVRGVEAPVAPIWSLLALVEGWGLTWLLAQGLWAGAVGAMARRPPTPRPAGGPPRGGVRDAASPRSPHPHRAWRRGAWGASVGAGALALTLGASPRLGWLPGVLVALGGVESLLAFRAWLHAPVSRP